MKQMQKRVLTARRYKFDLSKRTLIMGVLNVTPDSFSDGGQFLNCDTACKRALQMEKEGADIIDIGGESTRPGSLSVCLRDEIARIMPVISKLKNKLKIPVSVDTTKYEVALAALKEGVSIINDISGLSSDKRLATLCAEYSAGLVIMHIKGRPFSMQRNPVYKDLLREVSGYIRSRIKAVQAAGVKRENIVIDPGIGFGKRLKHNLEIIRNIDYFKKIGFPLMIGLSRKSFIGKLLDLKVEERLVPTIAVNAIAVYNGADIVRVHDVKEAAAAAKIAHSIRKI
jgi:dihydropteroate synthase